MFTALKNHDKVGLLFFADDVVKYIPPRKGRANVLRLIRELLATEPIKAQTDISKALEFLGRVQRRRCVVFRDERFSGARLLAGAGDRQPAARLCGRDAGRPARKEPARRRFPDAARRRDRRAAWSSIRGIRGCGHCSQGGTRARTAAGGLAPAGERRPARNSHRPALCRSACRGSFACGSGNDEPSDADGTRRRHPPHIVDGGLAVRRRCCDRRTIGIAACVPACCCPALGRLWIVRAAACTAAVIDNEDDVPHLGNAIGAAPRRAR